MTVDAKTWAEWKEQSCSLQDAIPYMTAKYRAEGMPEHEIRNILRLCAHLEGYIQSSSQTPSGQQSLYTTPWDVESAGHGSMGRAIVPSRADDSAHDDDRQRSSISGRTSTGSVSPANPPSKQNAGVPSTSSEGTGSYFSKAIDTSMDFDFGANEMDEI